MCQFPTTSKATCNCSTIPTAPEIPMPPMGMAAKIAPKSQKINTTSGSFLTAKVDREIQELFSYSSSINSTHRQNLQKTEALVKAILTAAFPEAKIWSTGSFPSGVDLPTSDLDMSVKVSGLEGWAVSKLFSIKQKLTDEFNGHFSRCYVQKARVPVLQLVDKDTRVEVDITIDNEDGKRNTQLLVLYGQLDARFPMLCRVVKAWAAGSGVEGACRARLNSFTLCLMVISYLQVGVVPAVLPSLQELLSELNGEMEVENDEYEGWRLKEKLEEIGFEMDRNERRNEATVGELYIGFMEYYSQFDFHSNWISVSQGKVLPKRTDPEGVPLDGMPETSKPMVICDPFYARNCADTVWHLETFQRLQKEFGLTLQRIKRTKSIFGGGLRSEKRRVEIDEVGMMRDLSIEKWRSEIEETRRNAPPPPPLPEGLSDEEKAAIWNEGWLTHQPYEAIRHPKHYWDLEGRPCNLEPWPVAEKPICYDFL